MKINLGYSKFNTKRHILCTVHKIYNKEGDIFTINPEVRLFDHVDRDFIFSLNESNTLFWFSQKPEQEEKLVLYHNGCLYRLKGMEVVRSKNNSEYSHIPYFIVARKLHVDMIECTDSEDNDIVKFFRNIGERYLEDMKLVVTKPTVERPKS